MAKLKDRITRLEQRQPPRLWPIGAPVSSLEEWNQLQTDVQAWVCAGYPEPQPSIIPSPLADFKYRVQFELYEWATPLLKGISEWQSLSNG